MPSSSFAAEAVERALADAGAIQLLAVNAASVFSRACKDGGDASRGDADRARYALGACLDASWNVTRVLAERVFLSESRGGRIVYLAPRSDAGERAEAARAGLENLARTLSIKWARHGVTAVAVAPRHRKRRRGRRTDRLPCFARRRLLLGLPTRSSRCEALRP